MKRYLWIGALILTMTGIMVTVILTWGHFNGSIGQICSAESGCNTVLTSAYSQFFGLPTALYGLLFYIVSFMLFVILPIVDEDNESVFFDSILGLYFFAFLVSVGLTIYSISVLGTTCAYCLASAGIVTLIFAGLIFWRIRGSRLGEIDTSAGQLWKGIGIAGLVFFLTIGALYAQTAMSSSSDVNSNQRELQALASDVHSIGNPNAPIRVVEFYDLACPHCQRFTLNVFPKIKKNYIDAGKVLWTFRAFPISHAHPNALYAHTVLNLVPPHQYLQAKKTIMRNADQWSSRYDKQPQQYFDFFMKQFGLPSYDTLPEAISNRISQRQDTYVQLGINRTPSFIVNGKLHKGGKPYQRWQRIFRGILNSQTGK